MPFRAIREARKHATVELLMNAQELHQTGVFVGAEVELDVRLSKDSPLVP